MTKSNKLDTLQALASQDGHDTMIVTNDTVTLRDSRAPHYGGTSYANSEKGIDEGINQFTYNILNPLPDK